MTTYELHLWYGRSHRYETHATLADAYTAYYEARQAFPTWYSKLEVREVVARPLLTCEAPL